MGDDNNTMDGITTVRGTIGCDESESGNHSLGEGGMCPACGRFVVLIGLRKAGEE